MCLQLRWGYLWADTHDAGSDRSESRCEFAKEHYKELNVTYVIWDQWICSVARASEGWRPMAELDDGR